MDFSTIEKRLSKSSYKTGDFVRDLDLVWSNCCKFNLEGSDLYNAAITLRQVASDLVADVAESGSDAESDFGDSKKSKKRKSEGKRERGVNRILKHQRLRRSIWTIS